MSVTPGSTCTRCHEERWPFHASRSDTCQRCREVLAGGNAVDPLTGAVRGSRRRPGQKPPAPSATRSAEPPGRGEVGSPGAEEPEDAPELPVGGIAGAGSSPVPPAARPEAAPHSATGRCRAVPGRPFCAETATAAGGAALEKR
jgi:hypothetical protein